MSPGSVLARVRAMHPHRRDALLATLVGIEVQIEALLVHGGTGERLAAHAIGLVAALCVAFHRRRPLLAFLASQAMFLVGQVVGRVVTDTLVMPLFVVLFLIVSASMQLTGRRFWLVPAAAAVSVITGLAVDDYEDDLAGVIWAVVFFVGVPVLGGRLLDSRRRLQRALRAKTARAEAERAERAERAAIEERERIAGDLHDVIAHALSAMVVQAGGARRVAERDPDLARASFAAIEANGREALGELRRLLGVLRREDEELALAPAPSLAHVAELARRVTASGLAVHLRVEGEPAALPPGVDVTAYRVVQEALGAARDAGGAGSADVVVRYAGRDVVLEVRDDGPRGTDRARRLTGMRERVRVVGGDLDASRPRDGGYALRARLPTEVPA